MVGKIRTRGYLTSTAASWQRSQLRPCPVSYRDQGPIEVSIVDSILGRRF
jgi:hypothetical protein